MITKITRIVMRRWDNHTYETQEMLKTIAVIGMGWIAFALLMYFDIIESMVVSVYTQ